VFNILIVVIKILSRRDGFERFYNKFSSTFFKGNSFFRLEWEEFFSILYPKILFRFRVPLSKAVVWVLAISAV